MTIFIRSRLAPSSFRRRGRKKGKEGGERGKELIPPTFLFGAFGAATAALSNPRKHFTRYFGAFGALFVTLTSPSKHFHYDNRSLLAGSELTEGVVEH